VNPLKISQFYELNKDRFGMRYQTPAQESDRVIKGRGISRPGLAFTGFYTKFDYHKVQVCGAAETAYLKKIKPDEMARLCRKLGTYRIPCFIVTENRRLPRSFLTQAQKARVPVFTSSLGTEQLIYLLNNYLDFYFAKREIVHGTLVDVHGVGILLSGQSGIGKSEIALELLERGHRLVSDDAVTVYRKSEGFLVGSGSELLKHYLELRGIGIVDIRSIFGLRAIRQEKRLEVEVRLERWNRRRHYERVGLDSKDTTYLGITIPVITLPIFPGKNITVILEVIALNYILYQTYGYRPAEKLNERLIKLMSEKQRKK
jgi:HPr kinase/phosphorylase